MKYLSLFSGIGGIDLGLDRAGMTCIAQCEIDPFARAVLEKHWPGVPKYTDVKEINEKDFAGREGRNGEAARPTVDVVVGGFP